MVRGEESGRSLPTFSLETTASMMPERRKPRQRAQRSSQAMMADMRRASRMAWIMWGSFGEKA